MIQKYNKMKLKNLFSQTLPVNRFKNKKIKTNIGFQVVKGI